MAPAIPNSSPIRCRPARPAPEHYAVPAHVRVSHHRAGTAILNIRTGQVFAANRAGSRAWRAVEAAESVSETCEAISRESGLAVEQVRADVEAFLAEMQRRGLLRPVKGRACGRQLIFQAFWELVRYDLVRSLFGFRRIHAQMARHSPRRGQGESAGATEIEQRVAKAVSLASCFYWRPVPCLQRSVAAARLLRKNEVPAELVIGFRPIPFFSHAWVEVQGRVVNDSQEYARRLEVLDRL